MVGPRDDVEVVLHADHRVPLGDQAFEEGEDHPQGAKTFNGKTNQAFGIQNISKVDGGKLTVVHKTSIEDGMYPDEVDYTTQPL